MDELFEQFWKLYPRKVGKANALKAWKKLKLNETTVNEEIIPALREHTLLRQWQDKQYIPHASTWLNQRRFMDDISDEPKVNNGRIERPNFKKYL